jgi:hypothetical protein
MRFRHANQSDLIRSPAASLRCGQNALLHSRQVARDILKFRHRLSFRFAS